MTNPEVPVHPPRRRVTPARLFTLLREPAGGRHQQLMSAARLCLVIGEPLDGPGLHDQRILATRGEHGVENVERVDRLYTLHHVDLTHAVESGSGEPASIDMAAFVHEGLQLPVVALRTGERLVADLRVATSCRRHQRARAVEDQMSVESLSVDPRR